MQQPVRTELDDLLISEYHDDAKLFAAFKRRRGIHSRTDVRLVRDGPLYRRFKASASGLDPEGEADNA